MRATIDELPRPRQAGVAIVHAFDVKISCLAHPSCLLFLSFFLFQAYRDLAKIHHPDKVQGEEEKLKSEKIFQEVAEAYEVLGDDELRAK